MEPGNLFGLVRPRAAIGFEPNPAYDAFRKVARPTPERDAHVRFELPASVVVPAGATTVVKGRLINSERQPFSAAIETVGLPTEQVKVSPGRASLAPNATAELTIAVTPSRAMRSGKQPLLLACFAGGKLAGAGWLAVDVVNRGPSFDFDLGECWANLVDAAGKPISPLRPLAEHTLRPGDRVWQTVKITNRGTVDDAYAISARGPAAAWFDRSKARTAAVKAGQEFWAPLEYHVPADASLGTYPLSIVVTSQAHKDVQAELPLALVVLPATSK
jgi:hypothetical protein